MNKYMAAGYLLVLFALLGGVVWATSQEEFALWNFFVFFVPLMAYGFVFVSRKNPLEFLFLSILALLPILAIPIPPRRFGITVVDAMMLVAFFMLAFRFLTARARIPLMPDRYAVIALVSVLPSLTTSIAPALSVQTYAGILAIYIIFVLAHHYFQNPGWTEKFHLSLATALLIVSVAILFEKVTGINLSLSNENINALRYEGGLEVRRAAGFFQDPQKAAQFVACIAAYFSILLGQKSLRGSLLKTITLLALMFAVPALLLTLSRLAIVGGLGVTFFLLLFFNRYGPAGRLLFATLSVALLLIPFAFPDSRIIQKVAPESLMKRFEVTQGSADGRYDIWKNSWHIFTENPVSGIGPGTYQEYFLQEDPKLRRYKDMGAYVATQPESGYLKILYEIGIVGVAGCLYLLFGILRSLYANFRNKYDAESRNIATATFGSIMVFLLTFSTLFTTSDTRNALIPVVAYALLLARLQRSRVAPAPTTRQTDAKPDKSKAPTPNNPSTA